MHNFLEDVSLKKIIRFTYLPTDGEKTTHNFCENVTKK